MGLSTGAAEGCHLFVLWVYGAEGGCHLLVLWVYLLVLWGGGGGVAICWYCGCLVELVTVLWDCLSIATGLLVMQEYKGWLE